MHFRLEGALQPGVMAKDVILHCIGQIGFDGATYRAMQFDGEGATNLSIDDRMTIANMAIEAGGKNGIFEFDAQTKAFVDYRCKLNGTRSTYEPVERDRDEKFVFDMTVDLSELEPTVACHPDPGQRKLAKELGGIKLDRAYIGSCTGGKTSDFLEFARVLNGKRVAIDTFGVPTQHDLRLYYYGWSDETHAGHPFRGIGCAVSTYDSPWEFTRYRP
jgi:3-isopropylmalate/(R)-2-methylmalate dehydratase large subunit